LDETEKRITILMQNPDGKISETPFNGEKDDLKETDNA